METRVSPADNAALYRNCAGNSSTSAGRSPDAANRNPGSAAPDCATLRPGSSCYAPPATRGRAPAASGSNQAMTCATARMLAIPSTAANRGNGMLSVTSTKIDWAAKVRNTPTQKISTRYWPHWINKHKPLANRYFEILQDLDTVIARLHHSRT